MIRSIAAALILAGCSDGGQLPDGTNAAIAETAAAPLEPSPPPPEAYLRPSDRRRARRNVLGDSPCAVYGISEGVRYESSLPTDQCVRMLPRQHFRGVWFNRFEVSVFSPGRETEPDRGSRLWLDVGRSRLRDFPFERAYLLEFEGRRTMYPGIYGHFGYPHEIIVDRLISARPVQ